MKTFLWIEDRKDKAGYVFWDNLLKQICPDVEVVSKKNSSELVKAVKNINDIDNRYVIVFDNSFDNPQVVMEQRFLKQYADKKQNVVLLDIICFEYVLLEFENLIDWIYAAEDEFLEKRAGAVFAREKLIHCIKNGIDYKEIKEILEYDERIGAHNIEQLASRLLLI